MTRILSLNVGTENRLVSPFWWVCGHWLCMKVGLGIWAAFIWSQQLMPQATGYFYHSVIPILFGWQGAILGMWQRWDGIYYQLIAETHYSSELLTAFFPAYPFLARVFSGFTGLSDLASLQIVSAAAALTGLLLLYRIACDLYQQDVAKRVLVAALLFPTAIFWFALYPQSLALTWVLLAYQKARKTRWLTAGLAGLLAGLTHGTVVPLTLMLAVQAWQAFHRIPQKVGKERMLIGVSLLGAVCLPLLGTGIFLAWREAMGFLPIDTSMALNWGRLASTPWDTLGMLVMNFPALARDNWLALFNTLILFLAIGLLAAGWRQLPSELKVYQVAILLFLLSTRTVEDPLTSLNRYILLAFPMFLTMGALPMSQLARAVLFGAGVFASLVISALFFMWKWIG